MELFLWLTAEVFIAQFLRSILRGCSNRNDRIRWQSMVKSNGSTPATKEDLENLWKRIDGRFGQVDKRFEQVNQQFKDMRLYFDIAVEAMHIDFRGAFDTRTEQFRDELIDVKKRVGAIERRLRYSRS